MNPNEPETSNEKLRDPDDITGKTLRVETGALSDEAEDVLNSEDEFNDWVLNKLDEMSKSHKRSEISPETQKKIDQINKNLPSGWELMPDLKVKDKGKYLTVQHKDNVENFSKVKIPLDTNFNSEPGNLLFNQLYNQNCIKSTEK